VSERLPDMTDRDEQLTLDELLAELLETFEEAS